MVRRQRGFSSRDSGVTRSPWSEGCTRFEPAADLHAASTRVVRHHVVHEPPVLIDARTKPSFPKEVSCDPETAALVSRRWREYFPDAGVEMGDSEAAHLGR